MSNGQYPSSSELSALITQVGGITLGESANALRDNEQWVKLPSRNAGFACSSSAPVAAIKALSELLCTVHDVNSVLENSQNASADQAELERLAMLDPLTELPNRRKLFEFLHDILPDQTTSAILQIDLDKFKEINDSLGHAAGDEVLMVVANRLTSSVRPKDLVTRIGGDEFVVACPEINDEQAMVELADRLIASLGQPMQLQGSKYQIGASIGVSFKTPGQDIDVDTWLQNADLALYTSKEKGRNQFHLYETDMRQRHDDAQSMKQELSEAAENGSIIAHFQPTFCLQSGLITGVQAMARWKHSTMGIKSFAEFEKHVDDKMLLMIDKEMFNQCLNGIRRLSDTATNVSKFSITAPMSRIRDPKNVEYSQREIARQGLSPSQFSLEILEDGKPVEGDHALLANIKALREAGFGISLSGVGGSRSNLQSILHLQPHSVKLDSSLCRNLANNKQQQSLVRCIVNMAEEMNAAIVATAVETATDRDILARLGCSLVQGNVVFPPTDIDTLAEWLDSPDATQRKAA